jgi:hypothetical protein
VGYYLHVLNLLPVLVRWQAQIIEQLAPIAESQARDMYSPGIALQPSLALLAGWALVVVASDFVVG